MLTNVKVGDLIKGTKEADTFYRITNSEMLLGKVAEVNNEFIRIKIINHKEGVREGETLMAVKRNGGYPFEKVASAPEEKAEEPAEDVLGGFLEGLQKVSDALETMISVLETAVEEDEEDTEELTAYPEFKVGDKVKLTVDGGTVPLYGFTKGNIYTVEGLEERHESGSYIRLDRGNGVGTGYATADQLVKAEEFKAGAKAKVLATEGAMLGFTVGEIVTIEEIERPNHSYSVSVVSERDDWGATYARCLELVAEEEPAEKPTFKVGDKVKFNKGNSYTTGYEAGETYTITDPDYDVDVVEITGGAQRTAYPYTKDLVLVEEETAAPVIKVGDTVEIVEDDLTPFVVGTRGTVTDLTSTLLMVSIGDSTQILPRDHVKLVEPETTVKFKVGDKVKLLKGSSTTAGFHVGHVYTVEDPEWSTGRKRIRITGNSGCKAGFCFESEVELYTESETVFQPLKVGDVVKFDKDGDYYGDFENNGVIIEVDEEDFTLPYLVFVDGEKHWADSSDIKLA